MSAKTDFTADLVALIHKYALTLTTQQIADALQDAMDWVGDEE